jgi:hypothetical protein
MKACSRCGQQISVWRWMFSGLCPDCLALAAREQAEAARKAEAEDAVRRQAAEARAQAAARAREATRRKCPSCGGGRFQTGCIPDAGGSMLTGSNRMRFRPEGIPVADYQLYALACLDCGQVRVFLHEGDRANLDHPFGS